MNIQSEKLKLIEWLLALEDTSVIEKLKYLRENPAHADDWWNLISNEEKESVNRGLEDIALNKTVVHTEVRKKYAKWL